MNMDSLPKKRRNVKLIVCFVTFIMIFSMFTGCGNNSSKDTDNGALGDSNGEQQKEYDTLQIYAAYGGLDNIMAAFTEATGIEAEYISMSSGEVLSRMRAESGRALGDVWFGGGVDSFMVAAEEGLLETYISPEAQYIDDKFKDPDGYWTGVSIVLVSLVVNKDLAESKGIPIPETWQELIDSRYKGEILMPNPGISGTAFTFTASILQMLGEEKGWEFLDKLDENIPYYAERGSEPSQRAGLGEVMIGVSPDAVGIKREGYPIEVVYPSDGTAWWHSPVAIIKGTNNLEAAQKFVDWTLTPEGQAVLAKESPRPSTRPNVELPDDVPDLDSLNLVDYDFDQAAEKRDAIVDEWSSRYAN